MGTLSHLFVDISGLVVTHIIPAVVRVMLAVSLYQLARDEIRHAGVMLLRPRSAMRSGLVNKLVHLGRSPRRLSQSSASSYGWIALLSVKGSGSAFSHTLPVIRT